MERLDAVRREANQGAIMREGMKVVIAGRPNAGKSSPAQRPVGQGLGNRDRHCRHHPGMSCREHIHIDGMPLHIIDTAGLREASDEVERIGIERAWEEIRQADRVLFMVDGTTTDATDPKEIWPDFIERLPPSMGLDGDP